MDITIIFFNKNINSQKEFAGSGFGNMYHFKNIIQLEKTFILKEDESTYISRCSGNLLESHKKFRLIDLFSGAGGMSLGFSEHFSQPFEPVWANDLGAIRGI